MWDGNNPIHEWTYSVDERPHTVTDEFGFVSVVGTEPTANITTWIFEEGTFKPTAKIIGAEQYSIMTDYLGTPVQMYDKFGIKVWDMALDIYGNVRNFEGYRSQGECPFRYQGQYEDGETGLYYNRFRYYSPETGSYLSQDPIRLAGNNPTLYAYVLDPNTWLDPLGLDTSPILPPSVIINEGGVTIEHYYHGNDHLPAHAHVKGEGGVVKIGANGKPLKGQPELSSQQKKIVTRYKSKIRSSLNKINRWFKFKKHGSKTGCKS